MCLQTVYLREPSYITTEDQRKVQKLEVSGTSKAGVRCRIKSKTFASKYL